MREGQIVDLEQALWDHGLTDVSPDKFRSMQKARAGIFSPHYAHYSQVVPLEQSDGLVLVEKTIGTGDRKIPFRFAGELGDDYVEHAKRLEQLGIRVAKNYELKVNREGDNGIISLHQLMFPEGTLLNWIEENRGDDDLENAFDACMKDTLLPVIRSSHVAVNPDESWVFLDTAPKNVAPVSVGENVNVFYFDFFVPRVRNPDGSVKLLGFELHSRPEGEMQRRFFTKEGIIENFLNKTRTDLASMPDTRQVFEEVVARNLTGSLG